MLIDINGNQLQLWAYKIAKGAEGPSKAGARLTMYVRARSAMGDFDCDTYRPWNPKSPKDRKSALKALINRCAGLANRYSDNPQVVASYMYEDGADFDWFIYDRRTMTPTVGGFQIVYHRSAWRRRFGMRGKLTVEFGWRNTEAHETHWTPVDLLRGDLTTDESFRIPLPHTEPGPIPKTEAARQIAWYNVLRRPWSWRVEPVDPLVAALWLAHITHSYLDCYGNPTGRFIPVPEDTNVSK